jgi:transcriptional regulator with XRE-family HTH domain
VGYSARHRQVLADPEYREMVARLRQARESAGLTQTDLAEKMDVSWTAISQWERFIHAPSLWHLLAWWRALDFEVAQRL